MITRRALYLLLLAAPILALATIAPVAVWAAALYLAGMLALLAADFWLSPKPSDFRLARDNESKLSLGADNVVRIAIRRLGAPGGQGLRDAPVPFLLRDEPPTDFITSDVFLPRSDLSDNSKLKTQNSKLGPGETVEVSYTVKPLRRGDYDFGGCHLRYGGVLGLILRQHRYPLTAPVKVYPNLLEVRKYELLARRDQLFEIGLKNARRIGQGTEFERLRDYERDDDYRRINWPATARLHKPITTDYQPERSQSVIVMLDAGRLMTAPLGPLSKLDYAINTTLLLAYVAIIRGDRVGLLTFADRVTGYWEPDRGRKQFLALLEALYKVQPQQVEADYMRASAFLSTRRSKRSLVVLFTDIIDRQQADVMVRGFGRLAPRHLPVAVTMADNEVLTMAHRQPSDAQQMYEKVVAQQLLDDRVTALDALQRRGALTIDVPADKLTPAVVNKYLELKARGRL